VPRLRFEWPQVADTADTDAEAGDGVVRDANGNPWPTATR
jgi:protein PhnA